MDKFAGAAKKEEEIKPKISADEKNSLMKKL